MKNKTRFIPIVIIGAILLSLLAIVPAFGADEVGFIDPGAIEDRNDGTLNDSTPDDQEWARQGGMVGLMVEDPDLDVPVQRVLLPSDLTMAGTGTVQAHSMTIENFVSVGSGLADDDYIVMGTGTVRQVSVAEDDGTVTLDAPYAMRQSGDIYKVVITSSVFDDCTNCAMAEEISASNLSDFGGLGEFTTDNEIVASGVGEEPDHGNVLDALNRLAGVNLGGSPDNEDIVVVRVSSNGDAASMGVRRVSGKTVSMRATEGVLLRPNAGDKLYAAYWSQEENETGSTIKVRSQAHQSPVTIALTETTPSSGKFVLKVMLSEPSDDPNNPSMFTVDRDGLGSLPANPRDLITLSHPDTSATLSVETDKPVFSGFAPANNTSGRDNRPEVAAQVTDGDSGLSDDDVRVLFRIMEDGTGTNVELNPKDDGDIDAISGGYEVKQQFSGNVAPDGDAEIEWWVKATDKAGNVGYSDRQASKDGNPDPCDASDSTNIDDLEAAGCQPFKIIVDGTRPSLLSAATGRHWDSSLDTGDSDDKTEYRVSKADATSILVVFDEHLDDSTIVVADFEVDGAAPIDVEVHNVTVRDDMFDMDADGNYNEDSGDGNSAILGDDVQDVGATIGYVFLTVSEMDPSDQPKVELVGDVSDIAGNRRSGSATTPKDAADRIAPALTVSVMEGDRPVTKDKINISITSNENIGRPSVTYRMVMSSDDNQILGTEKKDAVVLFKSADEYTATIDASEDGLYTVYVTAQDSSASNKGSKGDNSAPVDVEGETSAILFERDTNISAPDVDPDMDGIQDKFSIDDPDAFIRIDFSGEGSEYDASTDGDDLDTHGMVTIVSAMLGDENITDSLQANEGSNVFLFHASGLDLGEHDLSITAMDEAGNKNSTAFEGTITITERKPYSLSLNPGWNLVSIPGEPMDSDINAVIPADHPAMTVLSFDPSVPGGWLTALRGSDGSFSGTLTDITGGRAYWINTPSFEGLKVDIPKQSAGVAQVLPTISVSKGWNLIPILDVDGDFELSDAEGYNYFNGLSEGTITGIYTFNTITNSWSSVAQEDVEIGKGYWVYATDAGVIVP